MNFGRVKRDYTINLHYKSQKNNNLLKTINYGFSRKKIPKF